MNRKLIARELLKVAKLLTGFWDLKIEPPSHADITKAKNVVIDCLQKLGAKCDKLAFQRFLVYQENKECTGQNCDRNSNKHLCIFGFEDKDGTFSGGVAGGRLGENNQPKMYAPLGCAGNKFGIAGKGAAGERTLKAWVDGYISKKTSQADAYQEVEIRV